MPIMISILRSKGMAICNESKATAALCYIGCNSGHHCGARTNLVLQGKGKGVIAILTLKYREVQWWS